MKQARRCVGSLALGMLTTIVVAWAGAALEHTLHRSQILEDIVHARTFVAYVHLSRGRLVDQTMLSWHHWEPTNRRTSTAGAISVIDTPAKRRASRTPAWSSAWLDERPPRPPSTWGNASQPSALHELAAGWPFRALRCEFDDPVHIRGRRPAAIYTPRRGLPLECHAVLTPSGSATFQPRALPYGIIPAGFSANTAIAAAVWFTALFGLGSARRGLRCARGRCPECAYDTRGTPAGSPCPECGTSASTRSARHDNNCVQATSEA